MANGPFDLGGLTVKELGSRVWAEVSDDNVWDAAAQLGYYFMLAMFPLIICLLSVVALLPESSARVTAPLSTWRTAVTAPSRTSIRSKPPGGNHAVRTCSSNA